MLRTLVTLGLICTALDACAPVPPPPVCGQPEVLRLVAERVERAGRGQVIEPGSVNQAPGATPDRLRCAVLVQTAIYDTNRFGRAPAIGIESVQYAVELRHNGVFLLPEVPGAPQAISLGAARPSTR